MGAAAGDGWVPLFEREDPDVAPVLFEGVPPHLEGPLRRWLSRALQEGGHTERVGVRLRVMPWEPDDQEFAAPLSMLTTLVDMTHDRTLLETVDAALHLHPAWSSATDPWLRGETAFVESVAALQQLLLDAGSAYRVDPDGRGLQQRVDATVIAAADTAREAAEAAQRPEAARDLAEAWAAVYGLHPNPSEAYRLAIRAVEDAAIPVVSPQNSKATLGTVLAHLRDASGKWALSITARTATGTGVEPLVAMLTLLWTGQSDRHAGQADLARVDQGAAEMAVHLAATLVQWFAAGHVQRTA